MLILCIDAFFSTISKELEQPIDKTAKVLFNQNYV